MKIYYYLADCNPDSITIDDLGITFEDFLRSVHLNEKEKDHEKYLVKNCLADINSVYLKGYKLNNKDTLSKYKEDLDNNALFCSDESNGGPEAVLNDIIVDINNYEKTEKPQSAVDKKTGKPVIIQEYNFRTENKYQYKYLYKVVRGYSIAKNLNLPGFAKLIGFNRTTSYKKTNIIFILEGSQKGLFGDVVKEYLESKGKMHDKINPTIRSKIIYGVASLMKQLYQKNILNRNLTINSIILDEKLEPKLFGYEYFKDLNDQNEFTFWENYGTPEEFSFGTPLYTAPELYIDGYESYGPPIDIFSYSILLYEMFTNYDKMDDGKGRIRSTMNYFMRCSKGYSLLLKSME